MTHLWEIYETNVTDIWKWLIYDSYVIVLWHIYDTFMEMTVLWQIYDRYMTHLWNWQDLHSPDLHATFLDPLCFSLKYGGVKINPCGVHQAIRPSVGGVVPGLLLPSLKDKATCNCSQGAVKWGIILWLTWVKTTLITILRDEKKSWQNIR